MPEAVLCPGFFAGRHWTYSERLVTVAVESRFWVLPHPLRLPHPLHAKMRATSKGKLPMPNNGAQKKSSSYLLAVEDQEFLLRDEMRPFRFGMEYAKAEYELRDWGVRSTVVVFGSARTPSAEQAAAQVKKASGAAEKRAAQKALDRSRFYEDARAFARIVAGRAPVVALLEAVLPLQAAQLQQPVRQQLRQQLQL